MDGLSKLVLKACTCSKQPTSTAWMAICHELAGITPGLPRGMGHDLDGVDHMHGRRRTKACTAVTVRASGGVATRAHMA